MPAILTPQQWRSQPQFAVGIDWSNPLSRGLIAAVFSSRDAVTQKQTVVTASAPFSAFVGGYSRQYASGSYESADVQSIASLSEITVFADCVATATATNYGGPFEVGGGLDTLQTARLEFGDGQIYFSAWSSAGTRSNVNIASGATVGDMTGKFALTVKNSTLTGYKNGSVLVSGAGPASIRVPSKLIAGANWSSSWAGFISPILLWARALSDAEVRAISSNPWQLLAPRLT